MDDHDVAELLHSELVCVGSSSTCSGLDFLYRWMECILAILSDRIRLIGGQEDKEEVHQNLLALL